jgi:hypothetical protein
MADEETNVGVSYERKDVRLGVVLALLTVAGGLVIFVFFGVWWFYWGEESVQKKAKGSTEALAPLFPQEPRLEQIDALAGMGSTNVDKRLVEQERLLNSYGPTEDKGFVHIPIQQAIEAVADKLPVRKQPPAEAKNKRGPADAEKSNVGKTNRGEP